METLDYLTVATEWSTIVRELLVAKPLKPTNPFNLTKSTTETTVSGQEKQEIFLGG